MKKVILSFYLLCVLFVTNTWATDLTEAKANGLIGETTTGYLATVTVAPSGEIKTLVDDINAKRQSHYQKIATKNGASLEAIERMAGETAIKKTLSGNFVMVNGQWTKK
ncbi:MAG: DUF1318 domain-containing protein [Gammaproteobacteria bacterium]|nr:DUF1318 domain-containing protein [Gammaproteobacteria bacterium]